jgi:hypothetical protein
MTGNSVRLASLIAAIDAANAADPQRIAVEGRMEPAALIYGRRMSATLARLSPSASEHLRIAARASAAGTRAGAIARRPLSPFRRRSRGRRRAWPPWP